VVSEDFLTDETKREALRRFLVATTRAHAFAVADPAAAIESTRAFIPDTADLEHERFILDTEIANSISPLTDANGLGWFTLKQFQELHDVLVEFGGIEEPIDVEAAIDRSILEAVYAN
jgi:ABC-type nitrate/sulfonate/bicarbonate transport system substrate-binding protein